MARVGIFGKGAKIERATNHEVDIPTNSEDDSGPATAVLDPDPVEISTPAPEVSGMPDGSDSLPSEVVDEQPAAGRAVGFRAGFGMIPSRKLGGRVSQDLRDCEKVIDRGLGTFIDVGRALLEIQEKDLYKERGYRSFAAYCETEWDLRKTTAYQLIADAKTVAVLAEAGLPTPTSSRAVAAVAKSGDPVATMTAVAASTPVEKITAPVIEAQVKVDRDQALRDEIAGLPEPLRRELDRAPDPLDTYSYLVSEFGRDRVSLPLITEYVDYAIENAATVERFSSPIGETATSIDEAKVSALEAIDQAIGHALELGLTFDEIYAVCSRREP